MEKTTARTIKKIDQAKILRCVKRHEASSYPGQQLDRLKLADTILSVLVGETSYGPLSRGRMFQTIIEHSDMPELSNHQYVGALVDELRYEAGMIPQEIYDYLNQQGTNHGTQGWLWLADTLAIILDYPLWKEPPLSEVAEKLSAKYERTIRSSDLRAAFYVAIGCQPNQVDDWLIQAKRDLSGLSQRKPRGYIGRIHNFLVAQGVSENEQGFYVLRQSVWAVIRSGKLDRRMLIKDLLPQVAKKLKISEGMARVLAEISIQHAALGGTYSEVVFRLVNFLEPQNEPLFQMADEILKGEGMGHRQRLRGYEALRTAMVTLVQSPEYRTQRQGALLKKVDERLGYVGWMGLWGYVPRCTKLIRSASKGCLKYQQSPNLFAFIKAMADELELRAQAIKVA